jgi:thioredoxin-related protein
MALCLALAGTGLASLPMSLARAQGGHLPQPRSLKALLARVGRDGRPVVAMFSIDGCPWCEAIRREQLNSLLREQAERGVQVVEFNMGDGTAFDDADGAVAGAGPAPARWREAASPAALARLLGVKIAPTLVFLGPDGEVAERLVGYGSPDFFSAYLDERIDQARRAVGAARRPPAG